MISGFAALAVLGFAAAYLAPIGVALAASGSAAAAQASTDTSSIYSITLASAQSLTTASSGGAAGLDRGGYAASSSSSTRLASSAAKAWVPPFVIPDPGTAQSIALQMVTARGWGSDQFACLVALWNRESGWNVTSYNAGSGAYGIPQALPGSKMASAGSDWATNPATQITWGLNYVARSYGTPCGAWNHSQNSGWY